MIRVIHAPYEYLTSLDQKCKISRIESELSTYFLDVFLIELKLIWVEFSKYVATVKMHFWNHLKMNLMEYINRKHFHRNQPMRSQIQNFQISKLIVLKQWKNMLLEFFQIQDSELF